MELVLGQGESRRYWKYHTPVKLFHQARVPGKIKKEKFTMLLDSGAQVLIVDTDFACKVERIIRRRSKLVVCGDRQEDIHD